jgi:hypothetical protein
MTGRLPSFSGLAASAPLCRRLLGRPASGSSRLCHGDGTQARGRDPSQGRTPPEGVHVAYPPGMNCPACNRLYLASDPWRYVTGSILAVDGGGTAS